jgi:cell division transport system permease protein
MSSLVMDSIATELRIAGRICQETLGGIQRSGWMNLVIVITMAAILSIFGTLSAFILETQLFFQNIGSGFEVSVYLKSDANLDDMSSRIRGVNHVKHIERIPKEKAWEDMRKSLEVPEIDNPLPDTIHVKMEDQRYIEAAVAELKQMEGIEEISYAKDFLKKLEGISNVMSGVGLVVSLFLGVLTMFVISNTIHLLIEARSREIEILRMMGVGNWYIRLPFLFQGALYGLVGALIAYIPLSIAVFYINRLFESFHFSTSGYSLNFVSTVLVLMGILVGAGGAFNSVRKYLRI